MKRKTLWLSVGLVLVALVMGQPAQAQKILRANAAGISAEHSSTRVLPVSPRVVRRAGQLPASSVLSASLAALSPTGLGELARRHGNHVGRKRRLVEVKAVGHVVGAAVAG